MDQPSGSKTTSPGSARDNLKLLRLDEITVPKARLSAPHVVSMLQESIARVGVINPVTVTHDHTLVAGMNRLVAARQLGLDRVPAIVLAEGEPAREIELSENLARLHLTPEQLAEAREYEARVLAEKQSAMSLRAAAEEAGVPETTARRRISKSGRSTAPRGAVERRSKDLDAPPTKRRGRDGKARPAKKTSKTAAAKRRARSKALRDEGKSIPQIADVLEVSVGTVAADLRGADLSTKKQGAQPRKRRTRAQAPPPPMTEADEAAALAAVDAVFATGDDSPIDARAFVDPPPLGPPPPGRSREQAALLHASDAVSQLLAAVRSGVNDESLRADVRARLESEIDVIKDLHAPWPVKIANQAGLRVPAR